MTKYTVTQASLNAVTAANLEKIREMLREMENHPFGMGGFPPSFVESMKEKLKEQIERLEDLQRREHEFPPITLEIVDN